jgi:hypothetical protein
MLRILTLAGFLFILPFLSVSAHAAEPAPAFSSVAPLKAWQEKTHAQIDHVGTKHGMDVWMALQEHNLQLIYTTPDKQGMLLDGILFGPNGSDETSALQRDFIVNNPARAEAILETAAGKAQEQASVSPPLPLENAVAPAPVKKTGRSEALWHAMTDANYISFGAQSDVDGKVRPLAYIFADPKCDHCHALWKRLEPKITAQALEVRLIPIAVLGAESEALAAQLLSQTDLLQGWDKVMKDQKMDSPATADGKAAFAANQALFRTYKMTSAPILIYRQHSSNTVRLVLGNPEDIKLFYADVGLEGKTAPLPPKGKE